MQGSDRYQVEYVRLNGLPFRSNPWSFNYIKPGVAEPCVYEAYKYLRWLINRNEIPQYKRADYLPALKQEEETNTARQQEQSNEVFNLFRPFPWRYKEDYTDEQAEADKTLIKPILDHIS